MKGMIKKLKEYLSPEYPPEAIEAQINEAEFTNVYERGFTVIWQTGVVEVLFLNDDNILQLVSNNL